MIIKLDKNTAYTEGTKELFCFDEDRFHFWPYQRKKVKFLGTENYKILNFLDTLELRLHSDWDDLIWHKKQ